MKKILLAVDVQPEFADKDGKYEEILEFINKSRNNYDEVIATVCKNKPDSPFVRYENWYECFAIKSLDFKADNVLEKFGYGLPEYESILPKDAHYDVIGFNTEACVLKIALDLFDKGYDFNVLTDYCYSKSGYDKHMNGVTLMTRLMSKAIIEHH